MSKALTGNFSSSSIDGMDLDSSEMNSDMHASADFRASLVVTQAKKAVDACQIETIFYQMKNSFDEKILDEAKDWINANQKVVLATVIQTWG